MIFRKNPGSADTWMFVGRTILIISLVVGGAINAFPLKTMLRTIFNMEDSIKTNIINSLFILFI